MNEVTKYNESTPFLDKLREDETFSDAGLLAYVKDFVRHCRKGSQTHLNSIVPLLQLANKLPKNIQVGNVKQQIKKEAQQADYEEVIPPDL